MSRVILNILGSVVTEYSGAKCVTQRQTTQPGNGGPRIVRVLVLFELFNTLIQFDSLSEP